MIVHVYISLYMCIIYIYVCIYILYVHISCIYNIHIYIHTCPFDWVYTFDTWCFMLPLIILHPLCVAVFTRTGHLNICHTSTSVILTYIDRVSKTSWFHYLMILMFRLLIKSLRNQGENHRKVNTFSSLYKVCILTVHWCSLLQPLWVWKCKIDAVHRCSPLDSSCSSALLHKPMKPTRDH